jgi:alpha-beta hydrolase superfamily lysophospholipase
MKVLENLNKIKSRDGLELFNRYWPVENPQGVVLIAHGLGEHSGNYGHVAEALNRIAGVSVLAFDFRGHGHSPGRRGVVFDYQELIDDLLAHLDFIKSTWPTLPRFVLGHSNGGQVVLRSAMAGTLDVKGMILSSPGLKVAAKVPAWKLAVGRLLQKFAPGVAMASEIDLNILTHDPEMLERHRSDKLRHGSINAPFYFGLIEGGQKIWQNAGSITVPALFLLGGSDPLVDTPFSVEVFERLGATDKTLKLYPEMVHEPLCELGREAVLDSMGSWVKDRLVSP